MRLVNGRQQQELDATDRGLQYGDGLFETIAVVEGVPRLWDAHIRRLASGCERLGLQQPDPALLAAEADQLLGGHRRDGVLKIVWTAGRGARGYQRLKATPTRILSLSPLPAYGRTPWEQGVAVRWCQLRLARQPQLAGIKHLNRLEQVLARAEWDDPAIAEGLLLDQNECVIEGTMSNVFVVRDNVLQTPLLQDCGVAGVMRERILELASAAGLQVSAEQLTQVAVGTADEVFLTNSLIGVWPVRVLAERCFAAGPVTRYLQEALRTARDVPDWTPNE